MVLSFTLLLALPLYAECEAPVFPELQDGVVEVKKNFWSPNFFIRSTQGSDQDSNLGDILRGGKGDGSYYTWYDPQEVLIASIRKPHTKESYQITESDDKVKRTKKQTSDAEVYDCNGEVIGTVTVEITENEQEGGIYGVSFISVNGEEIASGYDDIYAHKGIERDEVAQIYRPFMATLRGFRIIKIPQNHGGEIDSRLLIALSVLQINIERKYLIPKINFIYKF